jgi:endoglucanase
MLSAVRAITCASLWALSAQAISLPEFHGTSTGIAAREYGNGSSEWPYGPFYTRGRDIVNTRGESVTFAGVNWPSSGETMVPEGLEWASVEDIMSLVQSVGFNFVRLTYAIEMVDQIYERNGSDVPLEVAMINALGYENG